MSNTTALVVGEALLRLPDVLNRFPVSRAGGYEGVRTGRYPKPVKLGARAVAWRCSEIDRLIANTCEGARAPEA